MHIIIGIITALAGLVWALYRLQNSGVDLNAFNPFYWVRRKKWQKQLTTKAIHQLDSPLEAAILLVVGIATIDEDITRDLREEVITLLQEEFNISSPRATELYSSSRYLLQEADDLELEIKKILAASKNEFTHHQTESLIAMLEKAANLESDITEKQQKIIDGVKKEFSF